MVSVANRQIRLDGTEVETPAPAPPRQVDLAIVLAPHEARQALEVLLDPAHRAVGCACGRCILAVQIEGALTPHRMGD